MAFTAASIASICASSCSSRSRYGSRHSRPLSTACRRLCFASIDNAFKDVRPDGRTAQHVVADGCSDAGEATDLVSLLDAQMTFCSLRHALCARQALCIMRAATVRSTSAAFAASSHRIAESAFGVKVSASLTTENIDPSHCTPRVTSTTEIHFPAVVDGIMSPYPIVLPEQDTPPRNTPSACAVGGRFGNHNRLVSCPLCVRDRRSAEPQNVLVLGPVTGWGVVWLLALGDVPAYRTSAADERRARADQCEQREVRGRSGNGRYTA